MKVGVCSLGCKVNLYECEYIISKFKEKGYEIEDYNKQCDIYVINTCTVTNNADSKSRKMINHIKNTYPDSVLVVCGCFVESTKSYDFKDVDIVIGNHNKSKVVSLVEEFLKEKKQIIINDDITSCPFEDMEIDNLEKRTRAFVKIQDGCENFCTYCIIPYVRGRCRSKEFDKVIREITSLVNNGYKEIVLTGIHTGNYGVDINTNFATLLKSILEIPGLKRIRISSIEITELTDDFISLLDNRIICNQIHIPLQSGSANILKKMNRKYTKEEFKNYIEKIRQKRNDIAITTDVIVGFPSETDDDFDEMYNFIKEIGFAKLHVFPYSRREGTMAAGMKDQIDGKIKKERAKKLLNLSNILEDKYKTSFIGKEEEVLIEKVDEEYSYGHTSNYIYLKIKDKLKENEIYKVTIEKDML